MTKIPMWKLVMLLIYSCAIVSAFMFMFSLLIQWLSVSGNNVDFFGYYQLHVAFKMAIIGFILGILLWLAYYITYRKRLLNK